MKVCANCFNDIEIQNFIISFSTENGLCDFCNDGQTTQVVEIEELLDFFSEFLELFTPSQDGIQLQQLIHNDWNLFSGNQGTPHLINHLLSIVNPEIKYYDSIVGYLADIDDCVTAWNALKESIKWEVRYFVNIDQLDLLSWPLLLSKTMHLTEDEVLYRARIHKTPDELPYLPEDMGCPIREHATAGRANPPGIPYLYLSKTEDTTLYEVRSAFLDEISIGSFRKKAGESIKLVDFTEQQSAFMNYPGLLNFAKEKLLKREISADLSKPLRRYDSELEYIPTQFICEYVRYIALANGIIFDSSLHAGGKNIVLFHPEKMECIDVQKKKVSGINIEALNIR